MNNLRIDQFYESRDFNCPVKYRGTTKDGRMMILDEYHVHIPQGGKWLNTRQRHLDVSSKDTQRIVDNLKPILPPA